MPSRREDVRVACTVSAARVSRWFLSLVAPLGRAVRGVVAAVLLLGSLAVSGDELRLAEFDLARSEEGLLLSYAAQLELPRAVEDALLKGVPLYFMVQADTFRPRWYWRDERVAQATRAWRLAWQPLARRYRLSLGALGQNHESLDEALAAVKRASRWRIAPPESLDSDPYYVEFSLRLDTSQLPRPLQIGFDGQAEWDFEVERTATVPPAGTAMP